MSEITTYIDPFILGILISTGIGLIIGLEREYDKLKEEKKVFAGIRTFPIVAILGYILGILSSTYSSWLVIIALAAFLIFLAISHVAVISKNIMMGITTILALTSTFILGVMVANHLEKEAIATAVIIVTLLSLKTTFRSFIKNITSEELFAFIKFSIISLLILPFLPNQNYGPQDLLNPFEIGTIVVIISFINFIGYFLVKYRGAKKGILLTAILGGMVSSTAVTWMYASRSKETPGLSKKYAAGIIIATGIMFVRLIVIASIFNKAILGYIIIPFGLLTIICTISSIILIKKPGEEPNSEINIGNPLNIISAIGFGLLYVIILYVVHYSNKIFGDTGLYYSAIVAGLADTDAITISLAKFYLGTDKLQLATFVIITAALSNLIVKLIITMIRGSNSTKKIVAYAFGLILLIGILYILIGSFI